MRNRITTRSRVAVALLTSAMLVAGCGSSGGDTKTDGSSMSKDEIYQAGVVGPKDDAGTPKDSGTLTVADYSEARSLDPTKTIPNGAAGGNALAAVYDVLIRYDEAAGAFEPWLAESLTSNADNTVWTLKLRDGVTFSDGSPLNAAAVLGSIGYYMKNAGFNTLVLAQNIKDMKPQGDDTVVFTMNAPWTSFPSVMAGGAGMIMAPAAYQNPEKFEPIGAGPFTLESYKPSEELVLKAKPDYWKGKPHLDKLRFVWLGSDEAKMQSLEGGSVDIANIRAPKAVEQARKDGYAGVMLPSGLSTVFWINNREDRAGHDVRVRKAINAAIDPKVYMARTAGEGVGLPSRNIYAPTSRFYADIDTAGYDPELAKKLLDEAKADGYDGTLTYIGQSDPASQAGAVAVKAMLEKVGFEVKTEGLTNVADQIQRIYVTHDYDLVVAAQSLSDELLYSRLSTGEYSTSPQNPSGYANPEMDKLIDELRGADEERTKEIAHEVDKLWQETIPGVAMAAGAFFYPWTDQVHGVVPSTEQLLLFGEAWKG